MQLVRTRQFMLVLSVWFSMAFPWACMRHCAMHAASTYHPAQFVCQLQFHGGDPLDQPTTLGTNAPVGRPSLTLFVFAGSVVLRSITRITAHYHASPHWHTCFLATPVPPPKSA